MAIWYFVDWDSGPRSAGRQPRRRVSDLSGVRTVVKNRDEKGGGTQRRLEVPMNTQNVFSVQVKDAAFIMGTFARGDPTVRFNQQSETAVCPCCEFACA